MDNICVYGCSFYNNLVALVVPNPKNLATLAQSLGKQKNNDDSCSIVGWCRDPEIIENVTKAIAEFGMSAKLNKMEIPSRIVLCVEEWTPDNGLVTAAMKLKRKNIQNFYQTEIDRMYETINVGNNNAQKSFCEPNEVKTM